MRLLILLILALPSFAYQSIVWSSAYGSVDLSGGALLTEAGWRFETHITGVTLSGSQWIANGPSTTPFSLQLSGTNLVATFTANSGQICSGHSISVTGRTDMRIRVQYSSGVCSLEVWDGDWSDRAVFTQTDTGETFRLSRAYSLAGVNWQSAYLAGNMAFARLSTTTLPLNAAPPAHQDTAGNVFEYQFEGSLAERSGGTSLTHSGMEDYDPTDTYAAYAAISALASGVYGAPPTGTPSSAMSLASTSQADGGISAVWWECVSCPYRLVWSSQSSTAPTATMPVAGTYVVRLTATGPDGTVSATANLGAVAEDTSGNNVVPIDDPKMAALLGPVTRSGTSPWPWFDTTEIEQADRLAGLVGLYPGYPLKTGTVSYTTEVGSLEAPATITGSGTSFQTDFDCDGTDYIAIHYPVVGGGTGLRVYIVTSCPSQTSMTTTNYMHGNDAVQSMGVVSGASFGRFASESEYAFWAGSSDNINYYDVVQALYRLYYRTGKEQYRTAARDIADRFWKFPMDEARACTAYTRGVCVAPRVWGLTGLMARALDGRSDLWPGILLHADDCYSSISSRFDTTTYDIDQREYGYCTLFHVQIALVHPDSGTRATYLGRAQEAVERFWRPRKQANGAWYNEQSDTTNWSGQGAGPWTLAYALYALMLLYETSPDADLLDDITDGLSYLENYGYNRQTGCRGIYYYLHYTKANGVTPLPDCPVASGTVKCYKDVDDFTCTGGPGSHGPRTFAQDVLATFTWGYKITGTSAYLTRADDLFSAAYGKDGGAGSDIYYSEFADTTKRGKPYGIGAGAGRGHNHLAWRNGPPAAQSLRTVKVGFTLPSGASKARMTAIYPSGYEATPVVCTTSPCSVSVDTRHWDNHRLKIELLDSGDAVIRSVGDTILLPITAQALH